MVDGRVGDIDTSSDESVSYEEGMMGSSSLDSGGNRFARGHGD
jgi:hypothetical protein